MDKSLYFGLCGAAACTLVFVGLQHVALVTLLQGGLAAPKQQHLDCFSI
jgi:hypothetical protein